MRRNTIPKKPFSCSIWFDPVVHCKLARRARNQRESLSKLVNRIGRKYLGMSANK